jgi:hypothetical protein
MLEILGAHNKQRVNPMASKHWMTGMLGVYLTAAELTKQRFIVSPTSRSASGADLLVTDQKCRRAWSVQVKTNASTQDWWHMGASSKHPVSATHVYVFVSVPKNPKRPPQFYVVPSRRVAPGIKKSRARGYLYHRDEGSRDKWKKVFGDPLGKIPAAAY